MKSNLMLIGVLLFSLSICSQKMTKLSYKTDEIKNHKKTINQALKYNDAQTAINSLHKIIVLDGENSTYKDSLAIIYYQSGNYISSHLVTKELLNVKPKNTRLLEINAVSLQKMNAVKEAIVAYEKLFTITNNMLHGYQLANLQFSIKRLIEAKATIKKVIKSKEMDKAFVQFPVDKNENQDVPLKAAAFNLQGLIEYELKELVNASNSFNTALEISPKFALATQNYNAVLVYQQNEKNDKKASNKN